MTNLTTHLPCPFCGHRDIRSHHRGHPTSGEWVIECHGCSCELTGFATETDAWTRWNKRPAEAVQSSESPYGWVWEWPDGQRKFVHGEVCPGKEFIPLYRKNSAVEPEKP